MKRKFSFSPEKDGCYGLEEGYVLRESTKGKNDVRWRVDSVFITRTEMLALMSKVLEIEAQERGKAVEVKP